MRHHSTNLFLYSHIYTLCKPILGWIMWGVEVPLYSFDVTKYLKGLDTPPLSEQRHFKCLINLILNQCQEVFKPYANRVNPYLLCSIIDKSDSTPKDNSGI